MHATGPKPGRGRSQWVGAVRRRRGRGPRACEKVGKRRRVQGAAQTHRSPDIPRGRNEAFRGGRRAQMEVAQKWRGGAAGGSERRAHLQRRRRHAPPPPPASGGSQVRSIRVQGGGCAARRQCHLQSTSRAFASMGLHGAAGQRHMGVLTVRRRLPHRPLLRQRSGRRCRRRSSRHHQRQRPLLSRADPVHEVGERGGAGGLALEGQLQQGGEGSGRGDGRASGCVRTARASGQLQP